MPNNDVPNNNVILIIDLDETLLSINSFPVWAKYFLCGKFPQLTPFQRSVLLSKSAIIFAKRKLLGINHAKTKDELQKLWVEAGDAQALENIIAALKQKIRPNMQAVLELVQTQKIDAILASAAAFAYVEPLGRGVGFSHIIATKIGEEENRHDEKSRTVLEYIEKQGWQSRKKIFFTDHLEDAPLAGKSDMVLWFGKSEQVEELQSLVGGVQIVDCKHLSSNGVLTLF